MGANIVVRTDGLEEDKKEGKRERKKTKEEGAVTVLIHTSLRALKRIASCAHCLSACCLPSCLPSCLPAFLPACLPLPPLCAFHYTCGGEKRKQE
jgi:hypothetical protein